MSSSWAPIPRDYSVICRDALGEGWFLSEPWTMRLVIASFIVLTGTALTVNALTVNALTLPVPASWRVQWRDVVARVSSSRAKP